MARSKESKESWRKVGSGSRIAVYCKPHYYACKVIEEEGAESSEFKVRWENNDEEWVDLAKQKFRWQDYYEFDSDGEEEPEEEPVEKDKKASEKEASDEEDDDEEEASKKPMTEVDGDESLEEEEASTKSTKRKTQEKTAVSQGKKSAKNVAKDKSEDSDATPTMEDEEEEDTKVVTPPPAKKPKVMVEASKMEDEDSEDGDAESDADDDYSEGETQKKGKKKKKATTKPKKTSRKKASSSDDNESGSKRLTVKDVRDAHKKKETTKEDALLLILIAHHMQGTFVLKFDKIQSDLGYKPNNKALIKGWKDVLSQGFVEEAGGKGKSKEFRLSPKGIDRAAPEDYKYELENPPKTTAELHERIKARLDAHGRKIFEVFLQARDDDPESYAMSADEVADACGVKKSTKTFFYGMKQLKNQGYVVPCPTEKKKLMLSDKVDLE